MLQAFGSGDRAGVLTWSASASVVMTLLSVVMSGALWFADAVAIHLFRQPEHIASVSRRSWRLPGDWCSTQCVIGSECLVFGREL